MKTPLGCSASSDLPLHHEPEAAALDRRSFLRGSLALAGSCALVLRRPVGAQESQSRTQPIGHAKGIHPGRVVWMHDSEINTWKGPDDGHWWEGNRINQTRADAMMVQAVTQLTGASTVSEAWPRLFRHLNNQRGKSDAGYRAGEKIVIKPNWVGMIYREGNVNPDTYTFLRRHDYMNTAPQLILALLRQLTEVGVRASDVTICDTLAYLVNEYHDPLRAEFSSARYEDYAGKFGRIQVSQSANPLHWSARPENKAQDYLPSCFADADYLINFANLKAHQGGGVTLCAKNHYGSLIRWPVQQGYYDIHPGCFAKKTKIYRPLVDLMGHADLGGKTVLYLIDGLFSGLHPKDAVPRRMQMPPFDGKWPSSLLASQDPVAIDSVGLDFLQAEWSDYPRQLGVDDYLHEAALAADPPSGIFYDPNHATPTMRLAGLGVHEHWNNAKEKKYSRNLGIGEGIELVAIQCG